MKLAYADPPYPGNAKRHYSDQPLCQEVNHEILIGTLCEHYDGWALSTGSVHLRQILPLCPAGVRVAAWVKPFAAMKKHVVPMLAWEPVIFQPTQRKRSMDQRWETLGVGRDWHKANPPVFSGDRGPLKGVKPLSFCLWLLDLLGYQTGDIFDDLFPGSGVMKDALALYGRQRDLFPIQRAVV